MYISNTGLHMLTSDIISLIDSKIFDINKNTNEHYKFASKLIKKLNYYIDGKIDLDDVSIDNLVVNLLQPAVLLDIPLSIKTTTVRARKFTDKTSHVQCYENAEELSYIPLDKIENATLGRMNKNRQSMYYGCISIEDNNIGTILAEVNSKKDDTVCIMSSNLKQNLLVRHIGTFHHYKHNVEPPIPFHHTFKEMYEYYKKGLNKKGMRLLTKCDSFFVDILTRPGSHRLYKVTSALSNICLEGSTDGVIYPSVKGNGAPNIVIKPNSVDEKMIHNDIRSFLITEDLGNALYRAKEIHKIIL